MCTCNWPSMIQYYNNIRYACSWETLSRVMLNNCVCMYVSMCVCFEVVRNHTTILLRFVYDLRYYSLQHCSFSSTLMCPASAQFLLCCVNFCVIRFCFLNFKTSLTSSLILSDEWNTREFVFVCVCVCVLCVCVSYLAKELSLIPGSLYHITPMGSYIHHNMW